MCRYADGCEWKNDITTMLLQVLKSSKGLLGGLQRLYHHIMALKLIFLKNSAEIRFSRSWGTFWPKIKPKLSFSCILPHFGRNCALKVPFFSYFRALESLKYTKT